VVGAIVPLGVAMFTDVPVFWFTRLLAASLWVLCVLPSFIYLRQNPASRRPIPFLQVISLVYGIYYVLPLTLGIVDNYYNAPVYVESDYDYPVQLAFFGWIAMIAGYVSIGMFFKRKPLTPLNWDKRVIARWGFMLMYGGIAAAGLRAVLLSATVVGGVFQFLLGLHWVGTGILIVLARRHELTRYQLWWLVGGFAISSAMMVANGSIAPMLMLFLVAGFAVWIGRPEIRTGWIVAAVSALLIASSFRGIAIEFRRATVGQPAQLSQTENLRLMFNLLGNKVDNEGLAGAIGHGLATTAGRSANLDLFANLVRRTPSEVPFWNGETYKSLIGFAVPRFLWPNKPTKDLGQAFGHRYNYIHASNMSTAINLPVLVEFYANFGEIGVVLGMLVVGFIYRIIDTILNRPGQSQLVSIIGVALMIPLFFIESDFSLIFGGLPLSGLAFYIVWRQFRKQLGPSRSAAGRGAVRTPGTFARAVVSSAEPG
jgi:hypothetical protein